MYADSVINPPKNTTIPAGVLKNVTEVLSNAFGIKYKVHPVTS